MSFSLALQQIFAPNHWNDVPTYDKKLKKLGRYASPQAALDALFNAQARISSGELKAPLKEDATPEEKAAWRAENNIPETPDKYELKLSDGLIVGDADKPLVDDFLK